MRETDARNVLVVGDLHEPFCKDGYLEFCQEQYDTWNCTDVVFIGDIIDNHYTSYHEIDIEAEYTGKQELEYAIKKTPSRTMNYEHDKIHTIILYNVTYDSTQLWQH